MTTDLRAALREAASTLDSYAEIGFTSDGAKARALSARLVALADEPPTVAELLAGLPPPSLHGRAFVEWTSGDDGDRMRARRSGARGFVVENSIDGTIWHRSSLTHSDLTQLARLVEVA